MQFLSGIKKLHLFLNIFLLDVSTFRTKEQVLSVLSFAGLTRTAAAIAEMLWAEDDAGYSSIVKMQGP